MIFSKLDYHSNHILTSCFICILFWYCCSCKYVQSYAITLMQNPWSKTFDEHFKHHMCRERRHRMDWEDIFKSCKDFMMFGAGIYNKHRTNTNFSYILDLDVRPTGEYSSFRIQTHDQSNFPKTIGGDSWRVFIKGPATLEALVYDLHNGLYETSFLLLEPGEYTVEVALQGSSCSAFVDPPNDWFKKGDFNGHFQELWHYKSKQGWPFLLRERMWSILNPFKIIILPGLPEKISNNLQLIRSWETICEMKLNCNFLWDGFGRWVNNVWKPYVNDIKWSPQTRHLNKAPRLRTGTLWVYGDCYAFHFFEAIENSTLCKKKFFVCNKTYNWVYPRLDPDPKKDKTLHWLRHFHIDLPWLVNYFKNVISSANIDNSASGMLLNLGLHFIRSTSFANYRTLIDKYIDVIKQHKTNVIWRTTTSIHKPETKAHKRFQTHQRAMLFNAYSMSAMCNAGIPIIDVFPMTSSYPYKPIDGIHYNITLFKPVEEILQSYFDYL